MIAQIRPSKARGTVIAPPSKSMAHRLLICAGLSEGESVITHLAHSEDVLATIDCLRALGAECRLEGDTAYVKGVDLKTTRIPGEPLLPCRECGSTLRFFIPLALVNDSEIRLTGSQKLLSRPLTVYEELCSEKKLKYVRESDVIRVRGPLSGGEYSFPGNISSQFVSGLLFALPLLPEDSRIRLTTKVESRSYIALTLDALASFGVKAGWEDEQTLFIPGGQQYQPRKLAVEGDYSNAAFEEALNLAGGAVAVEGLREESLQGDKIYRSYFEQLKEGPAVLSLADCPDLGPILFVAAALLKGGRFTEAGRLAIKESDRGAAMLRELSKCKVKASWDGETFEVFPSELTAPSEPIEGHNDHRIVMAMAVLLTVTGGQIRGAEAVRKSFPDFWEVLQALQLEVRYGMD